MWKLELLETRELPNYFSVCFPFDDNMLTISEMIEGKNKQLFF